jgi:exosortase
MKSARSGSTVVAPPAVATRARASLLLAVALGVSALLAVLYAPVLRDLMQDWWDDPNYSHGFLVPLCSAFLVWRKRALLQTIEWRGSTWGFFLLVGGLSLLVLGQVGAEQFLTRTSLILVIAGLIWFHFGGRLLRAVLFPLAFLFVMIPLPAVLFYAVAFPLQSLAAQNAAWVLERIGVPVLLDGNVIHLSDISLGVTEACSGIRSLVSLLAVALGWAYLTLGGPGAMTIFVASAVPITILANAARVVLTGIIGQSFGRAYAEGFFHSFSGWLIFVFAFACLLGVHGALRWVTRRWGSRA